MTWAVWFVALIGVQYAAVCMALLYVGKPYQAGVYFAYSLGNVFFCLAWANNEA